MAQTNPETGLDAVLAALQTEDFPMEKAELYYAIGDLEVTDPSGLSFTVRTLLDHIDRARFLSVEDVTQALRTAMATDEAQTPPDRV